MATNIYNAKQLIDLNMTQLPMLIEDLFPKVGLVALAGGSDTGKSSFLRQLSIAICTGESDFLGFKINAKHKAVTYVSTEDDIRALAFLYQKQKPTINNLNDLINLHIITDVNPPTLITELHDHLKKTPCDLIVIDATSDIIKGDMNQQHVVREALSRYANLAKYRKCLILFLHHLNKNNLNGSQAFEAKMRSVAVISMKDGYNSNERTFQIVKGNYTPADKKKDMILMEFDESTLTFKRKGLTTLNVTLQTEEEENEMIEAILKYRSEGLSLRGIAKKISSEYWPIGKDKIEKIIKSNESK